jgi:hypothetical protein
VHTGKLEGTGPELRNLRGTREIHLLFAGIPQRMDERH